MTRFSLLVATAAIVGFAGSAAAQSKSACAPGQNKGAFVDFYGEGGPEETGSPTPGGYITSLGGALSGGFYGNTSNSGSNTVDAPDRGHGVTPSISPGPQTVSGGGGPGTGTSIGDFIQANCPD